MCVSLIVKSNYKGSVRDYMTIDQFKKYLETGKKPAWTRWELKWKSVAKKKKNYMNKSTI